MKALKSWGLSAVILVGIVALACLVMSCGEKAGADQKYYCPMHPTYIADRPGDCPICNMKLVPMNRGNAAAGNGAGDGGHSAGSAPDATPSPSAPGERRILYYRNPMDPSITSPVPMKDAMGMDYVPVYAEETASSGSGVDGYAVVETGAEGARLAGIQTAIATEGSLARTIRAVGQVKEDETRVRQVSLKSGGWVEKLWVDSTGQLVKRGQPLLSLYSPELLASQREFLKAREAAAQFANSDLPEVRKGAADLLEAARSRLELFDVPEEFIRQLEKTGEVRRTVTLTAPVSGSVSAKEVFEGGRVEPGMLLFTIADLSTVWIEGDIYEYEAPEVHVGQTATLTLPYDASARMGARVAFVYPYLNTETRTLRVRFEVDNPTLLLKPGMYANIDLEVAPERAVEVPESAILDTGERQILFVETTPGRYEPRQVRVGTRSAGLAQILSGLAAGDRVVVGANFLLDSESRLRSAVSASSSAPAGSGPGGDR